MAFLYEMIVTKLIDTVVNKMQLEWWLNMKLLKLEVYNNEDCNLPVQVEL